MKKGREHIPNLVMEIDRLINIKADDLNVPVGEVIENFLFYYFLCMANQCYDEYLEEGKVFNRNEYEIRTRGSISIILSEIIKQAVNFSMDRRANNESNVMQFPFKRK